MRSDMRQQRLWTALAVLLCGVTARGELGAQVALPATPPSIALPIHDVTVFSDRARIVRRGPVGLERGTQTIQLPTLPATVDPNSVRLSATGAQVLRVEVVQRTSSALPQTEAEAVLHELNQLLDQRRKLTDARNELSAERDFLERLTPSAAPGGNAMHPPLLLEAGGWMSSLEFFDQREAKDDAALVALEPKLRASKEKIAKVAAEALRLAGSGAGEPGYDVTAVVDARGTKATFSLAYVAMGARWYPAYDVRYQPGTKEAEVSFSGLVSQSTGEDWTDANLTLSTAIPATTATLPRLLAWKIGEKERFIPAPAAAWQPPLTSAPAPVAWATPPAPPDDQALRQALYAAANGIDVNEQAALDKVATTDMPATEKAERMKRRAGEPDYDSVPDRSDVSMSAALAGVEQMPPAAAAPPPSPPAPMAAPMMAPQSLASGYARSYHSVPTQSVAFGAPGGWAPPYLAQDLPAALAGGYTFVYRAAKPESVASGGEARPVALFTRRFPAVANERILPALSKVAYLVAKITNDGDRPLLAGRAHLFVGSDLVGVAAVPTTAVGESVTVPLGIDDAIQIDRNVHVLSSEQGLFSKEDVSHYEVVIELANPRSQVEHAVVEDQVPLAHGEKVEVKLDAVAPAAKVDKVNGLVDWTVDLVPGKKRTLTLRYSITRPKDWKLSQFTALTGTNP